MSNVGVVLTPEQVKQVRDALFVALNACDISVHRPTKQAHATARAAINALADIRDLLADATSSDEIRNGWSVEGDEARYVDARGRSLIQVRTVDDHPLDPYDGQPVFYVCAARASLIDPRASNAFYVIGR